MNQKLTREEAARRLGLTTSAEAGDVKRAYRRLAREHHPDLGGDSDTFDELQRAYERMVDDPAPAPSVSRGRPSRPPVPFVDETEVADITRVDWQAELPDGDLRLDADRLALWLASGSDAAVRAMEAISRSPGSKLNRVAHVMSEEFTSTLRVAEVMDDQRRPVVAVDVVGATRRARRALDRVALDGGWVRTRRSTATQVRATLPPSPDRRATALRATDRLTAMLEQLRWPLTSWIVVGDRRR